MPACPHCTKDLGSEFLDKATHLERLKVKTDEIAALKPQAEAGVGYKAAMEAAQAELAKAHGVIETRDLMGELKVTDERALNSLRAIHQMEQASVEEAKRIPFKDWIKSSDNPVVKAIVPAAAPATPATPATPSTPATPATPAQAANPTVTGPTATPTNPAAKMTPAQLDAYLNSREFLSMKPEDQVKKIGELEAQISAQVAAGPAL